MRPRTRNALYFTEHGEALAFAFRLERLHIKGRCMGQQRLRKPDIVVPGFEQRASADSALCRDTADQLRTSPSLFRGFKGGGDYFLWRPKVRAGRTDRFSNPAG